MSAASSSRAAKLSKLQHFKANLPSHTQAALHAMVAKKTQVFQNFRDRLTKWQPGDRCLILVTEAIWAH